MSDIAVVTDAEWQTLKNRRDAALARLATFEKQEDECWIKNKAYPADIALPLFTGTSSGGGYPASFGELNCDTGWTFIALGIEAIYTVSGVLSEDGTSPATLTIPETIRPLIFDYTWSIRDSGHDGDWSNVPLPSQVIRVGNLGRIGIGAHTRLAGGTKVTVTINPTFFDSTAVTSGLETLTSQSLQFILSGVAVKDGVL